MAIRVDSTAIRIKQEGGKFVAEVTPPDGQWRTPHPMSVEELAVELRNLGCDRTAAGDAMQDALLQSYRSMSDEFSPLVTAALNGEREVPPQEPFVEAWFADALFSYDRMLYLWEVLESADAINFEIPNSDRISWAFLRLRKRGWLTIEGSMYGLSAEGRSSIEAIVAQGNVPDRVYIIERWIKAHPLEG